MLGLEVRCSEGRCLWDTIWRGGSFLPATQRASVKTYCVPARIGGGGGPEAGLVGFLLGVVGSCWHASLEQGHCGPQMLEGGTWDPMGPEVAMLARGTGGAGAGSRKGRHSQAPSVGRVGGGQVVTWVGPFTGGMWGAG